MHLSVKHRCEGHTEECAGSAPEHSNGMFKFVLIVGGDYAHPLVICERCAPLLHDSVTPGLGLSTWVIVQDERGNASPFSSELN